MRFADVCEVTAYVCVSITITRTYRYSGGLGSKGRLRKVFVEFSSARAGETVELRQNNEIINWRLSASYDENRVLSSRRYRSRHLTVCSTILTEVYFCEQTVGRRNSTDPCANRIVSPGKSSEFTLSRTGSTTVPPGRVGKKPSPAYKVNITVRDLSRITITAFPHAVPPKRGIIPRHFRGVVPNSVVSPTKRSILRLSSARVYRSINHRS